MLFIAGKFNFLNLVCHQISSIVKMFQDFVETLPNWSQSSKCSLNKIWGKSKNILFGVIQEFRNVCKSNYSPHYDQISIIWWFLIKSPLLSGTQNRVALFATNRPFRTVTILSSLMTSSKIGSVRYNPLPLFLVTYWPDFGLAAW